jgi:hypothetical protein
LQLDLFGTSARRRQLEVAIDTLAKRFGNNVLQRANDFTNQQEYIWSRPLIF